MSEKAKAYRGSIYIELLSNVVEIPSTICALKVMECLQSGRVHTFSYPS